MTDTVTTPTFPAYLYPWQTDTRNRAGLRVVEPATAEPVSLDEAASHLRIDAYGSPPEYPDQTMIEAMIVAAREYVEHESGLALAPQTMELGARSFAGLCQWSGDNGILLRVAPVLGIASVIYTASDGTATTMDPADYTLDDFAQVPAIYPAYGSAGWPSARDEPNAVRIRFYAGYSGAAGSPTVAVIPQSLRFAILLMLGHLYENREQTAAVNMAEIPLGITSLIQRYRIRNGFA